jgi:hydrogenase-4 component F
MLLHAIILLPAFLAVPAALLPSNRFRTWLVPVGGFAHLILTLMTVGAGPTATAGPMLGLDALGTLILLVVSLLYAVSSIYAIGYLHCHMSWGTRTNIICLLLFLSAMSLATMARNLGLLWVAVESTTLVSAPLIYYHQNKLSIEATWKYLLLCSVGIALAMLGIFFVAYAGLAGGQEGTLQLDHVLGAASQYSRLWLRAGFVFLLVGFGTKMGLAPLHSWKPDVYGEAPGLIGGLLAGGLTSIAFLAILRAMQIMAAAGEQSLARHLLLVLGIASLTLAAVFVVRQKDIKRMLAYSSIEHMGILAIGVGIGGLATYGAMFHILNNALTKGALFMSAANIHRYYGSKRICETQGSLGILPFSASLFLVGFLAITGSPPFSTFVSEFTILRTIFAINSPVLAIVILLLLAMVFIGMGRTVIPVTVGPAMEEYREPPQYRETILTVLSPLLLMAMIFCLGIYLPAPLHDLFSRAASIVEVSR